MTWQWNSYSNDISNNVSNEFSVLQPNIVPLCKGGISQVIVPGYTRVSTRVPGKFSPQDVNKEFQQSQFPVAPPNHDIIFYQFVSLVVKLIL